MTPAIPKTVSSADMIRVMGLVSLICGLLIVITYKGTLAPIGRNQEILTREAVAELLPGMQKQVIYAIEGGELKALPSLEGNSRKMFAGFDASGKLLGIVLEGNERGYADNIKALYAYSPEKQAIVGFKVIELKETPGLGDKIVTDRAFLENFRDLDASLTNAITAVKHGTKKNRWEVDAISGATISSRAVGRLLDKSAREFLPVIQRNLPRIQKGE